jgi:hypothetical protein
MRSSETRPMMRSRSGSMISPDSTIERDVDAFDRAAVVLGHDDVLRHVDQAAGQVAGVGRLERRIGQALARAVRRDEVLEHGEAFAEVRRDGRLDDFARRLGHQSAHAGELANLLLRSASAGVGHDVDRVHGAFVVGALHVAEHLVGDLVGNRRPHLDDLVERSPLVMAPSMYCFWTSITFLSASSTVVYLLAGMTMSSRPTDRPDAWRS